MTANESSSSATTHVGVSFKSDSAENSLSQNHEKSHQMTADKPKEVDIYRDTPIRLLGYANEVGEAFRALIPVSLVRTSYAVATGYVIADTFDKSRKMMKIDWRTSEERNKQVALAAGDTLIWQTLASVVIPGFTINRACALANYVITRTTKLPLTTRKWATTVIGLSCIPFIVKPIDRSVDFLMDATFRAWLVDGRSKDFEP